MPAMAMRFFSPKLRWCGKRSAYSVTPARERPFSTLLVTSSSLSPMLMGPKETSSHTRGGA